MTTGSSLRLVAIAATSAASAAIGLLAVPLYVPSLEDPIARLQMAAICASVCNAVVLLVAVPNGNIARAAAGVLIIAVMIAIASILLGAPLLDRWAQTWYFALYVSSICAWPVGYFLRDRFDLERVYYNLRNETLVESHIAITTIGTIAGAWLGAFVIPLDWDRPWQVWPISCAYGACAGLVVASLLSVLNGLLFFPRPSSKLD